MQGQSSFTLCQYPVGNDIFKSMFQRGSDINSGKFIGKAKFPRNAQTEVHSEVLSQYPF